jgi:hypothetical protein
VNGFNNSPVENIQVRVLSATSVKVGKGYRLALPTGAYYTWNGSVLDGTPIEPDEVCSNHRPLAVVHLALFARRSRPIFFLSRMDRAHLFDSTPAPRGPSWPPATSVRRVPPVEARFHPCFGRAAGGFLGIAT